MKTVIKISIVIAYIIAVFIIVWLLLPNTFDIQKSDCEKSGGFLIPTEGMMICVFPTIDEGKQCTDSGQCQGSCNPLPDPRYSSSGKCEESEVVYNNRCYEDIGLCSARTWFPECQPIFVNGTLKMAPCT